MAEFEKRRARRLNALERMSDAGLESLLLQDFQSQETGESSMDEVLRAAEILSERKDRPTSSQADRAWAEFLENYLPSSGDGLSLYEDPEESAPPVSPPQNASAPPTAHRSGRHPLWLGAIRTAACLLLCFFLGGGLLMIFHPATMAAFSGWVREIAGDHYEYRYSPSKAHETPAKDSEGVVYRPTWMPEGYRLNYVVDFGSGTTVVYGCQGNLGLTLQYLPSSAGGFSIHMEGLPEEVTVRGDPADLYFNPEDGKTSSLIWGDTEAELLMFLAADLPREDLLRVAESIRPGYGGYPPDCEADMEAGYKNEEGGFHYYTYTIPGFQTWENAKSSIQ